MYLRLTRAADCSPLDGRWIDEGLRALDPHLSLARLRQGFYTHFVHLKDEPDALDEILAAFISNQFPFRVLSTAFYCNIGMQRLNARSHRACCRVVERIRQAMRGI